MNLSTGRHFAATLILVLVAQSAAGATSPRLPTLIFDSFNGPVQGGFTSPEVGVAQQVVASREILLTNIAEYSNLRSSGNMIFHIWDPTTRTKLFETSGTLYDADAGSTRTWKVSPSFLFRLEAGGHYVIGATSDVSRNTYYDNVPESQNGVTSEMVGWTGNGYPTTSMRPFIIGGDSFIRLYAIPEPSCAVLGVLSFGGVAPILRRVRRVRSHT